MIPSQVKSPIQIQTVNFGADWLEITYIDNDRQSDNVREMVTVAVSYDVVEKLAEGIYDDLIDCINKAHVAKRNPPPTVPGGKK